MAGRELGPVGQALVEAARDALQARTGLRFVVGAAGTGKTTVCAAIGERLRIDVLDMDARIYGTWHGRFDPVRHPASHAWSAAADPLAWQLALEPGVYLAFQEASTAEALDLLGDELRGTDPARPLLVDGGFGSVAALARIVPPDRIVCLALPPEDQARVWTATEDRREFLDVVARVSGVDDPVGRFLALDVALSAQMIEDARAVGIRVLERAPDEPVAATASAVEGHLGLR
jgi:hypothetical protein